MRDEFMLCFNVQYMIIIVKIKALAFLLSLPFALFDLDPKSCVIVLFGVPISQTPFAFLGSAP